MSETIDVGRVYHTTHETAWHRDAPMAYYFEDLARMYGTSPLYGLILETQASDHLMSASTADAEVRHHLSAIGEDEIYPTNCEIVHARLWAAGHYDIWDARHDRDRYPNKASWKSQRRYQAHDRNAVTWALLDW